MQNNNNIRITTNINGIMKSSETSQSRLTIMRKAFAIGCKNLGISQETCLNLTLLLQSLEEIETMVWALEQAEEAGVKWTRTEVVLLAERIKEKYLAKQAKEKEQQTP